MIQLTEEQLNNLNKDALMGLRRIRIFTWSAYAQKECPSKFKKS